MQTLDSTRNPRRLVAALAAAGVATGITLAPVSTPSAAAATTVDACPPTTATGWRAAVTNAQKALASAVTSLQSHDDATAITQLRTVKQQVRIASTGATALIGKPPLDPESDIPPGPDAVLKVANLEHSVNMKLVPLFNQRQGRVVRMLGATLNGTDACRDYMLGTVIALAPAKLDDYTDGLSDTLPGYKTELATFTSTLSTAVLTDAGRARLTRAQQVVIATSAAMNKAFGGGERADALTRWLNAGAGGVSPLLAPRPTVGGAARSPPFPGSRSTHRPAAELQRQRPRNKS